MNFFLDHDVPIDVGRVLRLKGHLVQFLDETLPRTTDDLSALRYAASQGMMVITVISCAWPRPNLTLGSSF